MTDPATRASEAQRGLQADFDGLSIRFAERAADGSLSGRRGLYQHHARLLRQAAARLADGERLIREERP